MELADLLAPGAVVAGVKTTSKKQLLSILAAHAGTLINIDERRILEAIQERERLGSTGLGGGVAIPHAKLPGLTSVIGVFMQLETPVDFDSLDASPRRCIAALVVVATSTAWRPTSAASAVFWAISWIDVVIWLALAAIVCTLADTSAVTFDTASARSELSAAEPASRWLAAATADAEPASRVEDSTTPRTISRMLVSAVRSEAAIRPISSEDRTVTSCARLPCASWSRATATS